MSVKSDIETCGRSSGADVFHYERPNMENISIDEIVSGQSVCYLEEINSVTLSTDSNGISDTVNVRVSFIEQADFSEKASYNSVTMDKLLQYCRKFLIELVQTGNYQKKFNCPVRKYEESVNDANFIGWSMDLTLIPNDGYSEC